MSKKIFKMIISTVLAFMMCGSVFATPSIQQINLVQQITPTHQQTPVPNVPKAQQHTTPTHQQTPVPNVPQGQQHITPTHQAPTTPRPGTTTPTPGATPATPGMTTPTPTPMPPTPRPGAVPTTPAPGATPATPGTTTPTPTAVPTTPRPGTTTPTPGTMPMAPGATPTTPSTGTTPRPGTTTPRPGTTTAPTPGVAPRTQSAQPFVLDNFKVIEKTLNSFGVDSKKLAHHIKQGKKLEDVLKAEKISVRKFKKRVIAEYFKAVDQGIVNKQLTAQQASQLKKAIKETVKAWLPRK